MKLYDAAACPFCARVRLVLAEKRLEPELVPVDLRQRPEWIYALNPSGRVPVLDDGFVLPESTVIMEYLEERYPEPALLPSAAEDRARARLAIFRFDAALGDPYYALRRGEPVELEPLLAALPLGLSLLSDYAYLPWIVRLRERLGVELPGEVADWLDGLAQRPAVARELELVAAR